MVHHFRPALLTELTSWTGAEVVSTEAWPKCCGGGLSGIDDALSTKMLGSVVEGLKRTGATQILTPCPFCFVQFDLRQREMPVLFLSELFALAFGAEPQKIGLNYHRVRPII